MSNHEGPSRRRRIAGESKPSDARVPGAAKKVVRRPVARPGAPVPPPADEPRTTDAATPEVEDAAAPPEVEEAQEADVEDTVVTAPAPRVAPRVGRRPRPATDGTPAAAEREMCEERRSVRRGGARGSVRRGGGRPRPSSSRCRAGSSGRSWTCQSST